MYQSTEKLCNHPSIHIQHGYNTTGGLRIKEQGGRREQEERVGKKQADLADGT